jgi:hypothetical protein
MRVLLLALLLLGAGPALGQARPPAPPADLMAAPGKPGWSVDRRLGCWVWNGNPKPNETVIWSGACDGDGRATGLGVLEWHHGGGVDRYEGGFRAGKEHGKGIQSLASGNRYEGAYQNGQWHGRGVWTGVKGDRYEGQFRKGERHGKGVLIGPDGDRYEGEWRQGKQNGRGVYVWPSLSRYEGEWRDGNLHGKGVRTWPGGDRYEGTWREDRPHGYGEATLAGADYRGNWVGGCFREGGATISIGRPVSECP